MRSHRPRTSENQPSGTKYGSSETLAASSIFVATPDLTTNQLKYRLRSYSLEIIGLGESSRRSCSTSAHPRPIISREYILPPVLYIVQIFSALKMPLESLMCYLVSFSLVVQEDVFTIPHLAALQVDSCMLSPSLPLCTRKPASSTATCIVTSIILQERSYLCVQCRMQKITLLADRLKRFF